MCTPYLKDLNNFKKQYYAWYKTYCNIPGGIYKKNPWQKKLSNNVSTTFLLSYNY